MDHEIEPILSLLLWIAAVVTTPMLLRVIRIQKRTIDALTIHVQVLTEYIESSRVRVARGETAQNGPASKIKKAG